MSNIRVSTTTSNVSVRVGQENAVKVLSSAGGGANFATEAENSFNVIGGIGSITQLDVSGTSTLGSVDINSGIASLSNLYVTGVSTFIGVSTFGNARFYNDTPIYGDAYFYSSIYYIIFLFIYILYLTHFFINI